MAGWTNRGKMSILDAYFRNNGAPANFYVAMVTAAAAPGPDTNILSDLTEIAAGNGYVAGGISIARNAVDFDTLVEDDVNDRGEIQIIDVVWTAAGGPIPSDSVRARYAVLTDDNGVVANREVYYHWDFVTGQLIDAPNTLTLADLEMRLLEDCP